MGGQASLLKFLLSSRTDVLNFSDPSCKQVLSTIPQLQMNFPPALMNPVILNPFSFLFFLFFSEEIEISMFEKKKKIDLEQP